MKRILSIDGGGIKGMFAASFLASIEENLGLSNVSSYFDLIVGTSTGGIIAVGLGLGLTARDIRGFYEEHGRAIFHRRGILQCFRGWLHAKYESEPLELALKTVFGTKRLGDSSKRLVIPALNLDTGDVHLWKTAHHIRFQTDYKHLAVEVAMATAAAPAYFPTFTLSSGVPLVDGGTWANNPVAVAVIEAIGVLNWAPSELRVLTVGCTTKPLDMSHARNSPLGRLGWALRIIDVFMAGQSSGALGMAMHLIPDRQNIIRVSPIVGTAYELDGVGHMPALRGLGSTEARTRGPSLQTEFFSHYADQFEPLHRG